MVDYVDKDFEKLAIMNMFKKTKEIVIKELEDKMENINKETDAI